MDTKEISTLVHSENKSVEHVTERDGLKRGYTSPRRYYGDVLAEIEDAGCSKHIDEKIFFLGCQKLGGIYKAKIYSNLKQNSFRYVIDKNGSYLPPEKIASKMWRNEDSSISFYIRHRGNWGINLGSSDLRPLLTEPLVELLCEFNKRMEKLEVDAENLRDSMRRANADKSSISFITTSVARVNLINSMLR